MSFSLSIPRTEQRADFEDAAAQDAVTPKADARTKAGKRQNVLVEAAREALIDISEKFEPPFAGSISGHVNPDLSGNVNVTLTLLS